jgi:hypothetical protein
VRPLWCTPAELEEHVKQIYRQFYSLRSMLRRLPSPTAQANIASWVLNLSERRMARTMNDSNEFELF